MNNIRTLQYLDTIERLLRQWDGAMADSLQALAKKDHLLLPVLRIRAISQDLLKNPQLPTCDRLHADLAHLIYAHTDLLFGTWTDRASFGEANREYLEALVAVHAEMHRVRDRLELPPQLENGA